MLRWLVVSFVVALGSCGTAHAQFAVGGVYVDPEGIVRRATTTDDAVRLPAPGANDDVATPSDLRFVSLARLERRLSESKDVLRPATVEALAGLHRLTHVFLLPDDVLLAGPAEGWASRGDGQVLGAKTGRPVLRLDDLLVALRYAFTEETVERYVGCSIDPTAEGLRRVTALAVRQRGARPGEVAAVAAAWEGALGPQAVRVFGVPGETPFALGLVAADVRLKRLAMGHDASPVEGVSSYVDLVAAQRTPPRGVLRNRFWFVGHFDELRGSADGRAFEFRGSGYRVAASAPAGLGGDDEEPAAVGSPAGRFAATFGEHAEELAVAYPELAGMQNRITLAIAAELIARPHLAGEEEVAATGEGFWLPGLLIDAKALPVARTPVPRFVASVAGVVRTPRGQSLVHVSGGVQCDPAAIVRAVTTVKEVSPPTLPRETATWWWDATRASSP